MLDSTTIAARCGLDAERRSCYDRFGFWCQAGPGGSLFLFIPSGQLDAGDGMPLVHARRCSPREAELWDAGRHGDIAAILRAQGMPSKSLAGGTTRRWWQRLKAWWRRMMG